MPDIIAAMNHKKALLLAEKTKIEDEARIKVGKINKQVGEIERAIKTVQDAAAGFLCKRCGGSGTIRLPDAAGQFEDRTCPDCKGAGVATDEVKLPFLTWGDR